MGRGVLIESEDPLSPVCELKRGGTPHRFQTDDSDVKRASAPAESIALRPGRAPMAPYRVSQSWTRKEPTFRRQHAYSVTRSNTPANQLSHERGVTMDSSAGGPPPLQFDTAVPTVAPSDIITAQGVTCVACGRAVSDEYFDVNGQSVCDGCRTQLAQLAESPRGWGTFAKAGLFGFVAAVLGAILYYAVIAITNFEIGFVAIAIGFMVGWAIRKATANRGGRRFQVLALVLTYWSVGLAYTPLTFQELAKGGNKEQAQGAVLVGFSLALPVLAVFGSLPGGLLSALIIGIGMRQAWQMTGAQQVQISGPYRISEAAPPAV